MYSGAFGCVPLHFGFLTERNLSMHWKLRSSVLGALVLLLAAAVVAEAAESAKKTNTVITVGEMCGGCVKRITAALEKMPDINDIKCDVKTKTVTVTPKKGKTLSPRALWEEMEKIGKRPTKLVGPSGTYTSKPKK